MNRRWRNLLLLGTVSLVVLSGGYLLRGVVTPLLLGLLVAYVLDPLVGRLGRLGLSRRAATWVLFVAFLMVAGALLLALIPQIESAVAFLLGENGQDGALVRVVEQFRERAEVAYQSQEHRLARYLPLLAEKAEELLPHILPRLASLASDVGVRVLSLFNLISFGLLVPIYAFFFLLGMDRLRATFRDYLPGLYRERILGILGRIDVVLSTFFRGRLLICAMKGAVLATGFAIVGVPYAVAFGFVAGGLSILPVVGPILGGVVPVLVAVAPADLLEGGSLDVAGGAWVVGVLVAAELIEGWVLFPLVLGKGLDLHPLTLIVALLAGSALMGFYGLLVAVPLVAVLKILGQEIVLPVLQELAEESRGAETG